MHMYRIYFCKLVGGLDVEHLSPVDYRTELREAKARVDLPAHRPLLDEFDFSLELLLHALESQLKESGNLTSKFVLPDVLAVTLFDTLYCVKLMKRVSFPYH